MAPVTDWAKRWSIWSLDGDSQSLMADMEKEFVKVPLSGSTAVCMLTQLVHCIRRTSDISSETLHKIAVLCCRNLHPEIKTFSAAKFLASIFHIIKHFIASDNITEALDMLAYTVSVLEKTEEPNDELSDNCYSTYIQFTNLSTKLYNNYLKTGGADKYLEVLNILRTSLKLLIFSKPDHLTSVMGYVVKCRPRVSESNTNCLKQLICLQLQVLDLPNDMRSHDKETPSQIETFVKYYCSLLGDTVMNCIMINDYEQARRVLTLENALESIISSEEIKSLESIKAFLVLILYPIGSNMCDLEAKLKDNSQQFHLIVNESKKKKSNDKIFALVLLTATRVLISLQSKWQEGSVEDWQRDISVGVLTSLHGMFSLLSKAFQGCQVHTCENTDCKMSTSGNYAVKLHYMFACLLKRAVSCDIKGLETLLHTVLHSQKTSFDLCKEMKIAGCSAWHDLSRSTVIATYNFGIVCSQKDQWTVSNKYYLEVCQYLSLEESNQPPGKVVSFYDVFSGIAKNYKNLQEFSNALITLSMTLALNPSKYKTIFSYWINIKYLHSKIDENSELTKSTLWEVFTKNKALQKSMYPAICLENLNKCQVLTWELKAYIESDIKYLNASAFHTIVYGLQKDLNSKKCNPEEHARMIIVFLEGIHKFTRLQDIEACEKILESCKTAIDAVTNWPANNDMNVLCDQTEIWFMQFMCKKEAYQAKARAAFDKSPMVVIPTVKELAEVTPSYLHLNCRTEETLLKLLNMVLTSCQAVLVAQSTFEKTRTDKLRHILEHTALEYTLYGYGGHAVKAWALLYQLGVVTKDNAVCVLAASCLLPTLEYDARGEWMSLVDSMAESILQDEDHVTRYLIPYWLGKSSSCLHSEKYDEGRMWLKKAVESLGVYSSAHCTVLNAEVKLATCKYMCVPGSSNPGGPSPFEAAVEAFDSVISLIRAVYYRESSEIVLRALNLLCACTNWLAELCLRQKWPRDMQKYVSYHLEWCQKLGLATRTAQVLVYLAQGDLFSWKLDDCILKMTTVNTILGLNKETSNSCTPKSVISHGIKEFETAENDLRLELLPRKCGPIASPSVLQVTPFAMPEFSRHIKCQCCFCSNPLLQSLALDTTYMQGQCHLLQSDSKPATGYVKGAMKLLQCLGKKQTLVFTALVQEVAACSALHLTLGKALQSYLHLSKTNAMLHRRYFHAATQQQIYDGSLLKINDIIGFSVAADVSEQDLCLKQMKFDQAEKEEDSNLSSQLQVLSLLDDQTLLQRSAKKNNFGKINLNSAFADCTPASKCSILTCVDDNVAIDSNQEQDPVWSSDVMPVPAFKLSDSDTSPCPSLLKTPANTQLAKHLLKSADVSSTCRKDLAQSSRKWKEQSTKPPPAFLIKMERLSEISSSPSTLHQGLQFSNTASSLTSSEKPKKKTLPLPAFPIKMERLSEISSSPNTLHQGLQFSNTASSLTSSDKPKKKTFTQHLESMSTDQNVSNKKPALTTKGKGGSRTVMKVPMESKPSKVKPSESSQRKGIEQKATSCRRLKKMSPESSCDTETLGTCTSISKFSTVENEIKETSPPSQQKIQSKPIASLSETTKKELMPSDEMEPPLEKENKSNKVGVKVEKPPRRKVQRPSTNASQKKPLTPVISPNSIKKERLSENTTPPLNMFRNGLLFSSSVNANLQTNQPSLKKLIKEHLASKSQEKNKTDNSQTNAQSRQEDLHSELKVPINSTKSRSTEEPTPEHYQVKTNLTKPRCRKQLPIESCSNAEISSTRSTRRGGVITTIIKNDENCSPNKQSARSNPKKTLSASTKIANNLNEPSKVTIEEKVKGQNTARSRQRVLQPSSDNGTDSTLRCAKTSTTTQTGRNSIKQAAKTNWSVASSVNTNDKNKTLKVDQCMKMDSREANTQEPKSANNLSSIPGFFSTPISKKRPARKK